MLFCTPYKVLSIPWCTKSGAHIVPLTIWSQSSVMAHQSLPSHPVSNTAHLSPCLFPPHLTHYLASHLFQPQTHCAGHGYCVTIDTQKAILRKFFGQNMWSCNHMLRQSHREIF